MKLLTRKRIFLLLLLAVYVISGFYREFLFLNINEQSRVTYYHTADSHVSPSLQWLSHFSYSFLYYSKWVLTLLFAGWFAFLASRMVKLEFADKSLVRITWIAYGCAFFLGYVFFGVGLLIGDRESTYDLARFLAGLTETPAMLIILFASFLAIRKQREAGR
jgi:hypothetical protein